MVGSPIVKRSCRTKVKMVVVRVEKATAKEVHKAKKLAKQATMAELSFAKKLSKTLKGEREETFKPFNPKSKEGGASIEKESSKGEASKDDIQVVEQLGFTSNFSESSKEDKENLEAVNILKKPIKVLKQMDESRRAQEALEVQVVQEAQVAKEVRKVKLQFEVERTF